MVDLDAPIDQVPVAYVDVETTGLSPFGGDRICEIAVLRCVNRQPVDAFMHLINPQRPMDPGAYAIHRISDQMLAGQPTFAEVADDVVEVLSEAVLVGHNLAFDVGFLQSELRRAGRRMPPHFVGLDTLRLARRRYTLRRYGLGALAEALGLSIGGRAHRAMADVLLTRLVFEGLLDDLDGSGPLSTRHLQALQGGRVHEQTRTRLPVPTPIAEALEAGCALWLRYRSDKGVESERTVTPLRVAVQDGVTTLVAECHLRHELRTFRVDRIIAMEIARED